MNNNKYVPKGDSVQEFIDDDGNICLVRTGNTFKITSIQNVRGEVNVQINGVSPDLQATNNELFGELISSDFKFSAAMKEIKRVNEEAKKWKNAFMSTMQKIEEAGYVPSEALSQIIQNELNAAQLKVERPEKNHVK